MKRYTRSPLPFQGQKRYWHRELSALIQSLPRGATVIDVFGGSGLCSQVIKQTRPDLRVIWNDYDNFQSRLDGIPQTNEILKKVYGITKRYWGGVGAKSRMGRIAPGTPDHEALLKIYQQEKAEGADMHTLLRAIKFSSDNSLNLRPASPFYVDKSGTSIDATGYLEGVERISCDYQEAITNRPPDTLLILDPPYHQTNTERYTDGRAWGIADHIQLLHLAQGARYIYFTSSKSGIGELERTLERLYGISYFGEHSRIERYVNTGGGGTKGHTEILITNLPNAQQ